MMRMLLTLMASAFLLASCASSPRIVANISPDIDLRQFETFGFVEPMGTDRANGVRTPLSSALVAAASREMSARGLTQSSDPDLLLDFMVFTEQRIDVRQTPSHSVHRSYWPRGYSTWPAYRTTVRQYTEGSLVIDLIDPRNNRMVAEGSAQRRISNTDFTQQQIDDVVARVLNSMWAN